MTSTAVSYFLKNTFYFVAQDAIEVRILNKLDECGIEQVSPEEVQELLREGKREAATEILELLSVWEMSLLEKKNLVNLLTILILSAPQNGG